MASLYERMGGSYRKMEMVVAQFYQYLLRDECINGYLIERVSDIPRIHRTLTEFLVMVFGGPNKYSGKDVGKFHKTMVIRQYQFDAVWSHLETSLRAYKVPEGLIGEAKVIVYTLSIR